MLTTDVDDRSVPHRPLAAKAGAPAGRVPAGAVHRHPGAGRAAGGGRAVPGRRAAGDGPAACLSVGQRVGPPVVLALEPGLAADLGEEGYRLLVDPAGVQVRAAAPAGVAHGLQSFRQLLPPAIFQRAPVRGCALAGAGGGDRGPPAVRLAGQPPGFGPAFPAQGLGAEAPGPDGAAQAERVPLAPDRRPGLAPADPQVPEADRGGRLAAGQRPGATAAGGFRRRSGLAFPGPAPRRLLHAGRGARGGAPRRRTLHHRGAGDRDARARPGGHRGVPRAGKQRARAGGGDHLGCVRADLQRRGRDVAVPAGCAGRGAGGVSVGVHPRGRRRGAQAGVAARAWRRKPGCRRWA